MKKKSANRIFYQQKLNAVIEHIQNNLDTKIDLKKLAEISHFSPFHFHRICKALLGEPIGAFISRTRLETAARMIRYSHLTIEEIAYSVGYEAPSSLSKKFKDHFGISPIAYRKDGKYKIRKTVFMEATVKIKNLKVINVEDKQCIYVSLKGTYGTLDYSTAWKSLWKQIKEQKLYTAGIEHIGIPHHDPNITEDMNIRYDACLVIHKKAKPVGEIGVKTVEGGRFAVFFYQGPYSNLPTVYDYIFNEWLLKYEYGLRDEPVREKYLNSPERTEEVKLKTEIYLPIE